MTYHLKILEGLEANLRKLEQKLKENKKLFLEWEDLEK